MSSESDVARLLSQIHQLDWPSALATVCRQYPATTVFSTSFGLEDQAILDALVQAQLSVRVVTLDTGRLFEETHKVHAESRQRYDVPIEVLLPDPASLRALVAKNGPNGFYDSVENRQACCQVRKVEPLSRALAGADLWVTGIRREQSAARSALQPIEWDAPHGLLKFHPLLDVTIADIWAYIRGHGVPHNILHERGYPSIGCAPCTRAVAAGEPERSGRWWWEEESKKECGLHVVNGRLSRKDKA
jgi:phosphoadenosine phosphosulfate reductase